MKIDETVRWAIKNGFRQIEPTIVVDLFFNGSDGVEKEITFPKLIEAVYGVEANVPANAESKRVNVRVDPVTRLVGVSGDGFTIYYKTVERVKIVFRPDFVKPIQNDLWVKFETKHDAYFDYQLEEKE